MGKPKAKRRMAPEKLEMFHGALCSKTLGEGECDCLVSWVNGLQREADLLIAAIGRALEPLGTGKCKKRKCDGCGFEVLEAIGILKEALKGVK